MVWGYSCGQRGGAGRGIGKALAEKVVIGKQRGAGKQQADA